MQNGRAGIWIASMRMRKGEASAFHLQEPVLFIVREGGVRSVDGESDQLGIAADAVSAHRVHDSL